MNESKLQLDSFLSYKQLLSRARHCASCFRNKFSYKAAKVATLGNVFFA